MLSPQWLDELRARVTLSSVIMRTTKLQRAGREWKACCPFHNEKSPSFTVSDEKGFYHCFGCGAHGDVIRWMTDQRGLQFMDAIKELAAEAGMEVPAPDPRAAKQAEKRASLIDVTEAAQQWFVQQLSGTEGAKAREYLASRGFSDSIVREFGFGYAPEGRQALKAGLAQFDEAMLVESGMRIETEAGEHYDRFRERLMLPIQDARGRVIAFGGRILDKRDGVAKYLNSPDTPLFDKGRTLYNLHRASPASRQTGQMVVVEGYMDVIALANAGIEDAVAPLGTALTERQIEMLWRIVDRPILCFDGDAAGQRAAMRAIERALPLLGPSRSLQIAVLPKGLDPDDIVKTGGAAAMRAVLKQARNLIDALWEFELAAAPLETPEDKAGLKARLNAQADKILDPEIRRLYKRQFNDRYWQAFFGRRSKDSPLELEDRSQLETMRYWAKNPQARSDHLHKRLGASIAAGLMHWPHKIVDYSDLLGSVEPNRLDPRIDLLLEFFAHEEAAEKGRTAEFLRESGLGLPEAKEWDFLRFPYTRPQAVDIATALVTLEQAVRLYCNHDEVERILVRSIQTAAQSEAELAVQQRVRIEKEDLRKSLSRLIEAAQNENPEDEERLIANHA